MVATYVTAVALAVESLPRKNKQKTGLIFIF
jgi:hypothetical protein